MLEYEFLASEEQKQTLSAGEILFCEGESADKLYVVVDGEIDITVEGKFVGRVKKDTILGEMALVDDSPRSATATAHTNAVLLPVDRERFSELVREMPDFALQVMSIMSSRLRRMNIEELEKQKMEEELNIGRRIQLSLLPECCPTIPGWDLDAAYRSARQVGGDFYDFIVPPEFPNQLHIITADVTGKGVPAALFMASCRTAIRSEALKAVQPSEALGNTNRLVALDTRVQLFLSAFYAVLDRSSGLLQFSNGGMEWPLLIRYESGEVLRLDARGLVLGAFRDAVFEQKQVFLEAGDTVVFFSDGVTDSRNEDGEFFGSDSLIELVKSETWSSAPELVGLITKAVEDFRGSAPPFDDLTLVVLRCKKE